MAKPGSVNVDSIINCTTQDLGCIGVPAYDDYYPSLWDNTEKYYSSLNFQGFSLPSVDGGSVAFQGSNPGVYGYYPPPTGIFIADSGQRKAVVGSGSTIPGASKTVNLGQPSLSAGEIAFVTDNTFYVSGVYATTTVNGVKMLKIIADQNTTVLGTGVTFTNNNFRDVFLDHGNVVFWGASPIGGGIYTDFGGSLHTVADSTTPIPGLPEAYFLGVSYPSMNQQGDVFFYGYDGHSYRSLFSAINGNISLVYDNTPIEGYSGCIQNPGPPSVDGNRVAFYGGGCNSEGIFTKLVETSPGPLTKVVAIFDTIDGKTVTHVRFGREGLSGNQLAFVAEFADSTIGIYIATLPRPDTQPASVTNVVVTPNPAPAGDPVTLSATIDDTATGGSTITKAEYNINGSTSWSLMTGSFNSATVQVSATVTQQLQIGASKICVRGSFDMQ